VTDTEVQSTIAYLGFFFGRPPFLPFSREDAALASEVMPLVAAPPKRPRATAWGFFNTILHRSFRGELCQL
jgi:hypothetical protein